MGQIDPNYVITALIVLFLGIGVHEYAHCKLADAAGDPTPRYYGRVTLNLFKHFDAFGAMMIIVTTLSGYGIGWGKPSPMDSRKMRNPRWDFFAAVAAGPISNFIQATIYAVIVRVILTKHMPELILDGSVQQPQLTFLGFLLDNGVKINLALMFFNLIPLGPLDGHWLLGIFLPEPQRYQWNKWNEKMGTYILFGLIFIGQLSSFNPVGIVLGLPVDVTFKFLTGIH
jgi:Zn-dependent protease